MAMEQTHLPSTEQVSPVASPSTLPPLSYRLNRIFWGPNGLRALWRLAIFVGLLAGIRYAVHLILQVLHLSRNHSNPADSFTAKAVLVQDGVAFLCVLLA